MTEPYTRHYHILGIGPEATWQELRQAYKSLVNIWHPDRFQQDGRRRKLAEEKTKEITHSYKILAEYHKRFGALPLIVERSAAASIAPDIAPGNPAHAVAEPETRYREPPVAGVTPGARQKRKRFKFPSILSAAAVAGTAYFVMQIAIWEHSNNPPQSHDPDENVALPVTEMRKDQGAEDEPPKIEKLFTVGTSLGEVYAIQGVPSKTENDVWYYGESKIYFASGKVVRWEENPNNPLRANINPEDEKMRTQFFGKGSSKKDVLAVQGTPDRDSGNVWDYGVSRVYFDNGHVKGWDESPFNPLKVRR